MPSMMALEGTLIRRLAVASFAVAAAIAAALPAAASQPLPSCDHAAASTEVETWLTLGGGLRRGNGADGSSYFEIAADLAATFPTRTDDSVRLGPWLRVASTIQTFDPAGGLRLVVAPIKVDWFATRGRFEIALDLGAGYAVRTGAPGDLFGSQGFAAGRLSFGFRAPLQLYDLYPMSCPCPPEPVMGPSDDEREPWICRPKVGMVSGVRLYTSVHRSVEAPTLWEISFGLSTEVLGATWFLAGAN